MADIKRLNQIIVLATNNRREGCKTDEERELYDEIQQEIEFNAKWGIRGVDLINEIT